MEKYGTGVNKHQLYVKYAAEPSVVIISLNLTIRIIVKSIDLGTSKIKTWKLIEQLEEAALIDKGLSAAKHSKLKVLLTPMSIGNLDNPLVQVEYKGRQSNVILTNQGESTLKIFGD